MKEIELENITLNLYCENGNVRVKYNSENIILNNQNISMIISDNFDIVYSYYKSKDINNSESTDINTGGT